MVATVALAPLAKQRFVDNNGNPLAGGRVFTYAPASTTKQATYTDSTGATPNQNPVLLDGRGEAQIWLDTTLTYKLVAAPANDTDPPTNPFWTVDGVAGSAASGVLAAFTAFAASLLSSIGSSLVGFLQAGAGAVLRSLQAELRDTIKAAHFGALGNSNGASGNGHDDTAAIQAGLDYLGTIGGGTLLLTKASGSYRITSGLKLPSYVTIEGPATERYPFNGVPAATYLFPDFASPNQWVIEPKTTVGGSAVAFNGYITAFPNGPTYNCAVRNLQIRANTSATPIYGCIRMHGCPGAVVDNVSIVNTGHGILYNESYGGSCQAHTITYYSGFTGWQEVNATDINVYCSALTPATKVIPAGYVPTFMAALSAVLTTTYSLSTNAHYSRCFGAILGADSGTVSASNNVKVTVEDFSGGVFNLNTAGTNFERFYVEGAATNVDFACVAAASRFNAGSFHAFDTSTGAVFDFGNSVVCEISVNGILSANSFGTIFTGVSTLVTINGCTAASLGYTAAQYNVLFPSDGGSWVTPAFLNSWVSGTAPNATAQYRKNSRSGDVELKGLIGAGTLNSNAFILPVGSRPAEKRQFAVTSQNAFGCAYVLATGEVIPVTGNTGSFSLDGMFFRAEQ